MRESPVFEVRLRRFGLWHCMVGATALAAAAAVLAWAVATARSGGEDGIAVVVSIAALLTAATVALALSLVRVRTGTLACRDGAWSFVADRGPSRSGALTVALDWGSFLLLRLEPRPHAHVWLPVQLRGLERERHALRCAVYSPPRPAGTAAALASLPPE